jgi:aryl-alcohol dehydrogenase-like predicted oxidoreductase
VIKNSELVLGTANFGLNYGIANKMKKLSSTESSLILQEASRLGIKKIDTAISYGNAENILGNNVINQMQFQVITKLPASVFLQEGRIQKCIIKSLENSRQNSYLAVLLHDTSFLDNSKNREIRKELSTLKKLGLTLYLGASVYTEDEVKKSKEFFPEFNFFQILENVCDQRKYNSTYLQHLADSGDIFFVRSIFLQGMLLMNPNSLPQALNSNEETIKKLNDYCDLQDISVLDLCINYAKSIPWASGIVFGVDNLQQLGKIYESYRKSINKDFLRVPKIADFFLDPRNWS